MYLIAIGLDWIDSSPSITYIYYIMCSSALLSAAAYRGLLLSIQRRSLRSNTPILPVPFIISFLHTLVYIPSTYLYAWH
ncbi:hypothetical protein GGI42DRAFT_160974 [Trichoderma sp. SZMC 28013]